MLNIQNIMKLNEITSEDEIYLKADEIYDELSKIPKP